MGEINGTLFTVHVEFINGCVIIFGMNGPRIGVATFFSLQRYWLMDNVHTVLFNYELTRNEK